MRISLLEKKHTMRRKLFGYMFVLAAVLLIALFAGLFMFGHISGTDKKLADTLRLQMEVFDREMSAYYNELAVRSINLSENTSKLAEQYFAAENISFENLNGSAKHIEALEGGFTELLRQDLLKADCSGAYIMLNTSQNAGSDKAGVYIMRSTLGSVADDTLLLYRGNAQMGKRKNIMPHRKWHLEFKPETFPEFDEILNSGKAPLENSCRITDIATLPGTSERVMLVSVPVWGNDGTLYGICGFEISESIFKKSHAQPTTLEHLICVFSRKASNAVDTNRGFCCGVDGGYYLSPKGVLEEKKLGKELLSFENNYGSYAGITKSVQLYCSNEDYMLTVMIPKSDYTARKIQSGIQTAILVILLLFAAISSCLYLSKRYIAPILKGLEKIKQKEHGEATSDIAEIDDLFDFLAQKDKEYENSLFELTCEKEQMQNEVSRVQSEIEKLAYSRKKEVSPDDYEYFTAGLKTLTKAERNIFNMYLSGKTAKEIAAELQITERTIKYHNHNIYEKLGVSSRKQLLRLAALFAKDAETVDKPLI